MIKKLMLVVATLIATMGFAFAQVDVNKADAATLDGIKGIGPKTSKVIIDERNKGGEFKDWADFEHRVKGIKDKAAIKLSKNGLQVNGMSKPGAEPKVVAGKTAPDMKAMPDTKTTKPADAKKM